MSNNLTVYAANALLGGTAMPTTLYAKMHLGDPGPNALLQASADTRRRAGTLDTPSGGVAICDDDLEWTNWGANETLTHISWWDASSGGNPWWVGALNTPVTIAIGERLLMELADSAAQFSFNIWS